MKLVELELDMENDTPAIAHGSAPAFPDDDANPDLLLSAYDYELPGDRIAQNPAEPRDSSRLLTLDSPTHYAHHVFRDLPKLLKPGDLLVLNDTRVIPARLYGRTVGGARVEVLLLEELQPQNRWLALVKPGKRFKPGSLIYFGEASDADSPSSLKATVLSVDPATSGRILEFEGLSKASILSQLSQLGQIPLPPYITDSAADDERYQTVYAQHPGSVAAPTAGLHFTPDLLNRLREQGIEQTYITLHVGVGTFRPVEAAHIIQHAMHGEWLDVSSATVDLIHKTKARGGRVIAVGTTATRALEGAAHAGELQPYCGKTNLFIYPGYRWRVIDGLITNFHLPKSSLMMLVSALIGRQRLLAIYQEAIAQQYRFYSFGDAMLILPEARI